MGGETMAVPLIFNIQKFSVHDGPGIRTTLFFKGCPLACQWCHNPESQRYEPDFLVQAEHCVACGRCAQSCQNQAIELLQGQVIHHADRCSHCKVCTHQCYYNALDVVGQSYTVPQLMVEIEKDRPFYEQSGGGVTLSGGEVMTHIDFVEELIEACQHQGISVVVDTCGYAPRENFTRIMEKVDLFLYDLKLLDDQEHRHYTGKGNGIILENLQMLSDCGQRINLRLPLIEGINTDDEHIQQVLHFIESLTIDSINLLPYHHLGIGKYEKMNLEYPTEQFITPSDQRVEQIKHIFAQAKYKIKIGG